MSPLTPCGAPKLPSSKSSSALTALLESAPSWDLGKLLAGPTPRPTLLLLALALGWERAACVSALLPSAAASACSYPACHRCTSVSQQAACCPQEQISTCTQYCVTTCLLRRQKSVR